MLFFQRIRKASAFFFLIAFVAFSFSGSPSEGKTSPSARAEKYFGIQTVAALIVREEAGTSSTTHVEKQHTFFIRQWKAASLLFEQNLLPGKESLTLSSYNPLYIVITTHAP
jgi:hypothetical protein